MHPDMTIFPSSHSENITGRMHLLTRDLKGFVVNGVLLFISQGIRKKASSLSMINYFSPKRGITSHALGRHTGVNGQNSHQIPHVQRRNDLQ